MTFPRRSGKGPKGEDVLAFQIDLDPGATVAIDVQYNTSGSDLPDYPSRVVSYDSWYRDGSNCAWENEIIAYRYYHGMIDYFGKSYRGLCLDRLESDSYHHERLWGQDPYAVGKSPGMGGLAIIGNDGFIPCYGYPDDVTCVYKYGALGGAPVYSSVDVTVLAEKGGDELLRATTALFNDRIENRVRAVLPEGVATDGITIAPGLRKYDGDHVILDEDAGFLATWGVPVEEYGTVGTAFVWNPGVYQGMYEIADGRFPQLKPDVDGGFDYLTVAVCIAPVHLSREIWIITRPIFEHLPQRSIILSLLRLSHDRVTAE